MFVCVSICVSICLSVCKLCFYVKELSGTTLPRILKFGTKIEYDLLYCVRENQHRHAYHSLYLSIFSFTPVKFFARFLSSRVERKTIVTQTYF